MGFTHGIAGTVDVEGGESMRCEDVLDFVLDVESTRREDVLDVECANPSSLQAGRCDIDEVACSLEAGSRGRSGKAALT